MNSTTLNSNMSSYERGSRFVLAAVLIGAVLVEPGEPVVWLALVALYPMFTALMSWDPIYALFTRATAVVYSTSPVAIPVRVSQPRLDH